MSGYQDDKAWAKVIARAWRDPSFKERLVKDPKAVLNEAGIETASTVQMHEASPGTTHFVVPKRPAHITDAQLGGEPGPDMCCHA